MTHIEDRVIYGGVKGAREAILALRSLRDMLAGNADKASDVTVKWDGAPAVFAGTDPRDGQFFVAKKGIFNKCGIYDITYKRYFAVPFVSNEKRIKFLEDVKNTARHL